MNVCTDAYVYVGIHCMYLALFNITLMYDCMPIYYYVLMNAIYSMWVYVEMMHSSGPYTRIIAYTIYNVLCMLVNECIPNTIIYNHSIPFLLKKF